MLSTRSTQRKCVKRRDVFSTLFFFIGWPPYATPAHGGIFHPFLIHAFNPTTTGLPFTKQVVAILPLEIATTNVLPVALGVGSWVSIFTIRSLPSIFASMLIVIPDLRLNGSKMTHLLPFANG